MTERQKQSAPIDAELGQQREQAIDRAQGPGPVLDQDMPRPMPLFNQNERVGSDVESAIDPAEFAAFGQRSGEELDHVRPMGDTDDLGVAGRAAHSRLSDADIKDEER
ncbi:MAG TPA: hypothetical protein VFZ66_14665 [Herpetosiphonaceae bacterium]